MGKKGKEKATSSSGGGGSSSGKKKAAVPEFEDNIVFTNSDKEIKPRRNNPGPGSGSGAGAGEEASGPPKPTVKQIIGGSSWTGKLPVNLLSEHCQKQK